ncbi:MAG: T9SS type A sorting domain-containing protein [Bacteroidetes bacterium]|nr:T9SS type A sorting domain-containing protein [Bacteroidota bacterium]
MIKNIILIALMLIQFNCMSQTYTIPWATKQPAWVFPIWVEDASGAKDTVYFGFDSTAINSANPEPQFGEIEFNTPLGFYASTTDGILPNQYYKVHIFDTDDVIQQNLWGNIQLRKANFPVVLRWDPSTFYSDSLPFADQDPLPRGQCVLDWSSGGQAAPIGCNISMGMLVLMTDTGYTNVNPTYCIMTDTMQFNYTFPGPASSYFLLGFYPWLGSTFNPNNIDENMPTEFVNIFPVPTKDILKFKSNAIMNNIEFTDLNGRSILKRNNIYLFDCELELSGLNKGMYYAKITLENNKIVYKKIIFR